MSAKNSNPVPAVCGHGLVSAASKLKICERCYSSIRFTQRVPAGLSEEAQIAVQKIVESGVIKRAKTHAELAAEREAAASEQKAVETDQLGKPWQQPPQRGQATQIKQALEIEKPVVVKEESLLPKDVDLSDAHQKLQVSTPARWRGTGIPNPSRRLGERKLTY